MSRIAPYAKAAVAAVIAALSSLAAALVDDKSLGEVTDGQWITVALAFFIALGAVFGVPNKPKE